MNYVKKGRKLKGIASCLIVALLFSSLCTFAFIIQPSKATSETIYINADGSISPSTANITTHDNVTYSFTGNNYFPIVVKRNNITIDGNGHTLRGLYLWSFDQWFNSKGIDLTGRSNVTVKNITITEFYYGIARAGELNNCLSLCFTGLFLRFLQLSWQFLMLARERFGVGGSAGLVWLV